MREEIQMCLDSVEEEMGWMEEMVGLKSGLSQQRGGEESSSARLDSSMKKNTALIRKLRTLHDENSGMIMADISKVNQSKVGFSLAGWSTTDTSEGKMREFTITMRVCVVCERGCVCNFRCPIKIKRCQGGDPSVLYASWPVS